MDQKARGIFITLEGGEGSGKTTVLQQLAKLLDECGVVYMTTREPGGIDIAEQIRSLILDPSNTAMDGRTEALLYAAARRQHLVEKVLPALKQGIVVLCDRFIDSSLAYQGYARELGIEEVLAINSFATSGQMPDVTFYMDIEPEIGLARIAAGEGREINRLDLEGIDFHQKVREGYLNVANLYPERIKIIDASGSKEEVAEAIKSKIIAVLKDFDVLLSNS